MTEGIQNIILTQLRDVRGDIADNKIGYSTSTMFEWAHIYNE